MKYSETPAESYIVNAHCDCGAILEREGEAALLSDPPQIGYRCPACGARETLAGYYPFVKHRPAGQGALVAGGDDA